MKPRMSRESAQHVVAEQKAQGLTTDGVVALFTNRAYDALGYPNWSYFLDAELRNECAALSEDERAQIALGMREAGCSLRAVSAVVNWSHTKVKTRTSDALGVAPTTIGADGVAYRQPRSRKTYSSAVLDAGWELRNVADKLTELIHDERFEVVRDDLTDQLWSQLVAATKTTNKLLNNLERAPTS